MKLPQPMAEAPVPAAAASAAPAAPVAAAPAAAPEPEALAAYIRLARLAQVITNLLNNSAKYTEDGGQIWLTARHDFEHNTAVIILHNKCFVTFIQFRHNDMTTLNQANTVR